MSELAASGFRDVSRLASSDPEMVRDICYTNQANILYWLDEYVKELGEFRRLMSEGGEELDNRLTQALEARARWLAGPSEEPSVETPGVGEEVAGLFMGDRLARRAFGKRPDEGKRNK